MSLRRFILKRILATIPILIGVSIITFALIHLTPVDPFVEVQLDPNVTDADYREMRRQHGLHLPVYEQYFHWLGNMIQGDFGEMIGQSQDVATIIWNRLPETLALGAFGWIFAMGVAVPTGVYAAVNKDQLGDSVSRVLALSGISIPNFWLGLMLMLVFAVELGWFSVTAPDRPLYHPEMLWFLILPGVTLGTASAASIMRVLRTSMAEQMNKEYVMAARAKGLPERTVVLKHVLRNSLISVVTLAATTTAALVGGSVVVENVFAWPGLGREFIMAINQDEINMVMAITLITGAIIIIANLVADILYAALDPRIRYD